MSCREEVLARWRLFCVGEDCLVETHEERVYSDTIWNNKKILIQKIVALTAKRNARDVQNRTVAGAIVLGAAHVEECTG